MLKMEKYIILWMIMMRKNRLAEKKWKICWKIFQRFKNLSNSDQKQKNLLRWRFGAFHVHKFVVKFKQAMESSIKHHTIREEISLNKSELVASVAEKSGLTKKDAEKAVNAVFDSITATLVSGEKVQLVGFGTFEVRDRKERQGQNPQTKQPITIPATKVPAFKAGKGLKDAVVGK